MFAILSYSKLGLLTDDEGKVLLWRTISDCSEFILKQNVLPSGFLVCPMPIEHIHNMKERFETLG